MERQGLQCVIAGGESLVIHCAQALQQDGHVVAAVVTASRSVEAWARQHGVDVLAPGQDLAARLPGSFDWFFSITNLSVIPPEVLARAREGAVNFHDGPLPRYAGLYATAWALMNRESSHGITWHLMTDAVDEGDILEQRLFELRRDETSFTLNTRCYEAAIESFGDLIARIASGTVERRAQPAGERHYFGRTRRPAAAATLCWREPADTLAALVRALDFGPVENPLGLAKLRVGGDELVTVIRAEVVEDEADGAAAGGVTGRVRLPGTILRVDDDALVVATGAGGSGSLALRELRCPLGQPIAITALAARHGLTAGAVLPSMDDATAQRVSAVNEAVCRHERFWVQRLESLTPLELPYVDPSATPGAAVARVELEIPAPARGMSADDLVVAFAAWAARVSNLDRFDVAFRDRALAERLGGAEGYFASHVPLRVALDMSAGFDAARAVLAGELERVRARGSYAVDAIARYPQLRGRSWAGRERRRVTVEQVAAPDAYQAPAGAELAVVIAGDGARCVWYFDERVLPRPAVAAMRRQFGTFLAAIAGDRETALADQPILAEDERHRLLVELNATASDYPRDACIHHLIERQVARTPDAPALACLDEQLTYAQLDARANQLASRLVALGVGPDVLVGVCVERSIDLVVAMLGVMKAGGAYVPMDPGYPRERLALMIEDSRLQVLITQRALADRLPQHAATTVLVDADRGAIAGASDGSRPPAVAVAPHHLAYAIYTSGSTGRPKGVMVEHRNVVNFFAGMDDRVGRREGDAPGVWLAVTSPSFDISVLELFWTLARGFKVVLHADKADDAAIARAREGLRRRDRPLTFSLMYFASDEGENAGSADKYRLLIEGAKFGDQHGFSAVWTPERHFHAFGGLYPNPSVAAAALATITERIHLRAASVVMPLHHPIRVAEEWALVDNLSRGRVGISFASGWQPNDFVIYRPERFATRKQAMLEDLQTVRRLWRGETLTLPSPLGGEVEVRTLPRPVQKELPFWLTAAGNPETFIAAGELGANVLTHLLGQSLDDVARKIALYREAWRKAGHPGHGQVTIMLHTFVGPDAAEVKATVREPMKAYLRSSVELIKAAAWTFPTFQQRADATGRTPAQIFDEEELSAADLDAVLEHAFSRYHDTSGLFGTPAQCLALVERLADIGVDDIGCLLDYGVPSAKVLEHLRYLDELKELATPRAAAARDDHSLPAQIARHRVTHLQCTPSQLGMILAGEEARAALRGLRQVLIGGEAFPATLARELRQATGADLHNMYGPTETTVWSSTGRVAGDGTAPSIGRPIANTRIFLLDPHLRPVPIGVAGELYIGGDGVVRGYHRRPELTAERFVPDPWSGVPGARLYRTGDLARYRDDGSIEFVGRADFQVKIRGYRIELGEIEARIREDPSVREAVVVAREDAPGDQRLVAYLVAEAGAAPDVEVLRARMRELLPDYMVPSAFVVLERFPLTPNAKIDRKALPAPDRAVARPAAAFVAPAGELEQTIAGIWAETLNVPAVGVDDNFFDLGGHSLLTVQMHRRLREALGRPLALTDLFRFPTIRSFVEYLQSDGSSPGLEKSKDRAEARKAALSRRAELRDRRRPRS